MNRFPFYGPPFQYYPPYLRKNTYHAPSSNSSFDIPSNDSVSPKEQPPSQNTQDDFWLDIFGIKLYYDDILILSLLFFLYKEDVKDEWLFLALVLLLIS